MIVEEQLVYCPNCRKEERVELLVSFNSFIPVDEEEIERLINNIYCPRCRAERKIVSRF
ncbi:MAG TPA: hypothetical protein VFD05_02945 [Bacilli bacterium]|nr:hypothetical protein [Bacilli bacterium]